MESIQSIAGRDPIRFANMVGKIRAAGTDNLPHFGNGYVKEGGYSLQQNPDEFAALVLMLMDRGVSNEVFLEIGSASGGSCRFLHEHLKFRRAFVIDNHGHWRWPEQQANFDACGVDDEGNPIVQKWIGDSHSPEAERWLRLVTCGAIQIAFIDGDHSHEGCWADLRLLERVCVTGFTYVILHDIVACDGVKKTWVDGQHLGIIKPVAEFIGGSKPLGVGVGRIR